MVGGRDAAMLDEQGLLVVGALEGAIPLEPGPVFPFPIKWAARRPETGQRGRSTVKPLLLSDVDGLTSSWREINDEHSHLEWTSHSKHRPQSGD